MLLVSSATAEQASIVVEDWSKPSNSGTGIPEGWSGQRWLPQVSWIVAPEAFSEHGNWPANYGAWYISQVLDALTSNSEV